MKQYRPRFAPANPYLAWTRLAFTTGEMLFASAQVINHRTNRIATAGVIPNARDQREFTLMGQEKLEAAAESAQAIATRMVTLNTQFGAMLFRQLLSCASGLFALAAAPAAAFTLKGQEKLTRDMLKNSTSIATQLSGSTARLVHHGLKPVHSRATGNAKRLLKH